MALWLTMIVMATNFTFRNNYCECSNSGVSREWIWVSVESNTIQILQFLSEHLSQFHCCITNHPKLNGVKWQQFIMLMNSMAQTVKREQWGHLVFALWCPGPQQEYLKSGVTQWTETETVSFFTHKLGARAGMTQRLGSAGTTNSASVSVAWASC